MTWNNDSVWVLRATTGAVSDFIAYNRVCVVSRQISYEARAQGRGQGQNLNIIEEEKAKVSGVHSNVVRRGQRTRLWEVECDA